MSAWNLGGDLQKGIDPGEQNISSSNVLSLSAEVSLIVQVSGQDSRN